MWHYKLLEEGVPTDSLGQTKVYTGLHPSESLSLIEGDAFCSKTVVTGKISCGQYVFIALCYSRATQTFVSARIIDKLLDLVACMIVAFISCYLVAK